MVQGLWLLASNFIPRLGYEAKKLKESGPWILGHSSNPIYLRFIQENHHNVHYKLPSNQPIHDTPYPKKPKEDNTLRILFYLDIEKHMVAHILINSITQLH